MFEAATLETEGQKRNLADFYPSLSWMLNTIDAFRVEFADEAIKDSAFASLSECCAHAWQKIEKYYALCDKTPILYAAVILHPARKHHWFKAEWQDGTVEQRSWIASVKVQVEELWRTEYQGTTTSEDSQGPSSEDDDNMHVQLYRYKRLKLSPAAIVNDPFNDYLTTDPVSELKGFDPLDYWYQRRRDSPKLAKFAFDTLAIPLMSDDPERSFSAARDLITYRRSNLIEDVIQACACLRSWYSQLEEDEKAFDNEETILAHYRQEQGYGEQQELYDHDDVLPNQEATWEHVQG